MKILVIEDSENKMEKIVALLSAMPNIQYDVAYSYNSGLNMALDNDDYELLILDMTLHTFDKKKDKTGGRLRTFGGREIASELKFEDKLKPFVILTQYKKFDDNNKIKSFEEIDKIMKEKFNEYYKNMIFYDTSSSVWKNELAEEILKI
jgi:CheY-like chemotaxis protein